MTRAVGHAQLRHVLAVPARVARMAPAKALHADAVAVAVVMARMRRVGAVDASVAVGALARTIFARAVRLAIPRAERLGREHRRDLVPVVRELSACRGEVDGIMRERADAMILLVGVARV